MSSNKAHAQRIQMLKVHDPANAKGSSDDEEESRSSLVTGSSRFNWCRGRGTKVGDSESKNHSKRGRDKGYLDEVLSQRQKRKKNKTKQ